eukprot:GHVN01083426.1.p1 GENE.GHVN01083426.1~~GHVN01083426.1.p1  ORF type:complete len:617 (-),score=83.45 GHVN01083426.1:1821-3671(-)
MAARPTSTPTTSSGDVANQGPDYADDERVRKPGQAEIQCSPASITTAGGSPMSATSPNGAGHPPADNAPTTPFPTPIAQKPTEVEGEKPEQKTTPTLPTQEATSDDPLSPSSQCKDSSSPSGEDVVSPEVLEAVTKLGRSHEAPSVEVKLFVGRVPRTMNDASLKPTFEEYGSVGDVIIIRDRAMGAHKGCAFVRMKSITQADAAIRALNNQRTLEASLGPLQVKYAQGEAERLGMPAETAAPGTDQAKLFVGSLPPSAGDADIRAVFECFGQVDEVFLMRDDQRKSKGCAFVKFAFKEQSFHAIAMLNGKFTVPGSNRAIEVRFAESRKAPGADQGANGSVWQEYFTQDGRAYYHNQTTQRTQWERPPELDLGVAHVSMNENVNVAPNAVGAQTHGPPGANVFIFHIPNQWTENDLISHFSAYGTIVSARIATDRGTGRNRGFGFVSFNDAHSSVQAVEALNGYSVSGKRLKVQIKKGEEQYAPAQVQRGGFLQGVGHQVSGVGVNQGGGVQSSGSGGMVHPGAAIQHMNMLHLQLGGGMHGVSPQGSMMHGGQVGIQGNQGGQQGAPSNYGGGYGGSSMHSMSQPIGNEAGQQGLGNSANTPYGGYGGMPGADF